MSTVLKYQRHEWDIPRCITLRKKEKKKKNKRENCELDQCLWMVWSHHTIIRYKLTEWREWRGLMEWPPTWHHAALSHTGTWQALVCLKPCHRHKHLALASSRALALHSKEVPKHSNYKRAKRGLNQPHLHLPNGGGMCPIACAKKQTCIFFKKRAWVLVST